MYESIILTDEEEKILKQANKNGSVSPDQYDQDLLERLVTLGLLASTFVSQTSESNSEAERYVIVPQNYSRYRKAKKNSFIERKLPIIISIIALIKSFDHELISGMKLIMQLLK